MTPLTYSIIQTLLVIVAGLSILALCKIGYKKGKEFIKAKVQPSRQKLMIKLLAGSLIFIIWMLLSLSQVFLCDLSSMNKGFLCFIH